MAGETIRRQAQAEGPTRDELIAALAVRERELAEIHAERDATAEVLSVISRSAFELQSVLETLVGSAYRLCGGAIGLLYLRGGATFECRAIAGVGVEELSRLFKGRPIHGGRGTAAERAIISGEVECVEDFFSDPEADPRVVETIKAAKSTGSALGAYPRRACCPDEA